MILCDAGPLIALVVPRETQNHLACRKVVDSLREQLLTTWPCLTEAFHVTARLSGWAAQKKLWDMVLHPKSLLMVHVPSPVEIRRMEALMTQYWDRPMDLADASLVSLAESRRATRIFTLDSDFLTYRNARGQSFKVIPAQG